MEVEEVEGSGGGGGWGVEGRGGGGGGGVEGGLFLLVGARVSVAGPKPLQCPHSPLSFSWKI